MILVWKYDKNKEYTNQSLVDEIAENMTTVPLLGGIKPKFDETTQAWFDGATQDEIDAWNEANNKPSEPDKMEVRLGQIEEAVGMLATQVAKNTLLNGGLK